MNFICHTDRIKINLKDYTHRCTRMLVTICCNPHQTFRIYFVAITYRISSVRRPDWLLSIKYTCYLKSFIPPNHLYIKLFMCAAVMGHAVSQLAEELRYMPKFIVVIILPAALWLWVDSTSNRNEYQAYFLGSKGGRCIWLTTLPLSWADRLETWEPQTPRTLMKREGIVYFKQVYQQSKLY